MTRSPIELFWTAKKAGSNRVKTGCSTETGQFNLVCGSVINVLIAGFVTNTCLVWVGSSSSTGLIYIFWCAFSHTFCSITKYALLFNYEICSFVQLRNMLFCSITKYALLFNYKICSFVQLRNMLFCSITKHALELRCQLTMMVRAAVFVSIPPPPLPRKLSAKRALYETCPRLEMA